MERIKRIFDRIKKWSIWHPEHHPYCIYRERICGPNCPAYSEEEILLVISDIKENQLKTNCKELALKGAHIEALKIFSQNAVRSYMKQLMRENEQLKQGRK